jgi:hypothetical protein
MSALGQKRTLKSFSQDVRFTPKSDIHRTRMSALCHKRTFRRRRLQGFQECDEIAFLLVRETEIETLVVKFDHV